MKFFGASWKFIAAFLFGILCGLCWNFANPRIVQPEVKHDLPSISQIQEQLVCLGYPVKVDGRVGRETIEAWDKAYCEQSATIAFAAVNTKH
jgi:hypothetical protein